MQELEDVILMVQNSLISQDEGVKKTLEIIYTNLKYFGLTKLNEDQLHDFLIYQAPSIKRIFSAYNKDLGSFSAFLCGNIKCNLNTWKRMDIRRTISEQCTISQQQNEMEDCEYRYQLNEFYTECRDNSDNQELKLLRTICKKQQAEIEKEPAIKTNSHKKNQIAADKREYRFRREAILVLALKSCCFLDQEMIQKVSIATSVPLEALEQMTDTLIKTMNSKIKKLDKKKESRNASYFFKNRFQIEQTLYSQGSCWAETVSGKYEKNRIKWEKQNAFIQKRTKTLSPSNRKVAEVMGTNERRIYYIMKQLEKKIDTFCLKEYSIDHEDLFGNRKPE